MAQTGNKVAQRYRQMIVDAFLSLCHTYDYNEITILMIAQEADISRQTFYRHFKTKDDIIYYCLDTLSHRRALSNQIRMVPSKLRRNTG